MTVNKVGVCWRRAKLCIRRVIVRIEFWRFSFRRKRPIGRVIFL
jgi:hypothetical protein